MFFQMDLNWMQNNKFHFMVEMLITVGAAVLVVDLFSYQFGE